QAPNRNAPPAPAARAAPKLAGCPPGEERPAFAGPTAWLPSRLLTAPMRLAEAGRRGGQRRLMLGRDCRSRASKRRGSMANLAATAGPPPGGGPAGRGPAPPPPRRGAGAQGQGGHPAAPPGGARRGGG